MLLCGPCRRPHTTPTPSRTLGVLPASAIARGPQLIIHSVDRLVNTTFTCTVTNAVGTGRAEQVVLVRGERVMGVVCDDWVCSPHVPPLWLWGCIGGGCAAGWGRDSDPPR